MGIIRLITLPFRLVGMAMLLVVIIGGLWLWQEVRSADEASAATALSDHRAEPGTRAPSLPRAGVWSWEVEGSMKSNILGVGLTRRLPSRAPMIVRHSPKAWEMELRIATELAETWRFIDGDDLTLIWRRTDVGLLGTRRSEPTALQPAALWLPAQREKGRAWRAAGVRGTTAFLARSSILGRKIVTIGDQEVPTVILRRRVDGKGARTTRMIETWWWAPSLGIPVRISLKGEQVAGPLAVEIDAALRLASLQPEV